MSPPNQYPQFLLLGDSIIEYSNHLRNGGYNFGAGLDQHCSRRLDVVTKGLSGYNTEHVLRILPDLLPDPSFAKVDYLLVLFGANDASLPSSPSLQHVPLEKYRANLKTILTHPSITAHKPTVLLVTPPPINEAHLEARDLTSGHAEISRKQKVTAQYADAVREIVMEFKDHNVVLVDLWAAILKEAASLTPGYVEGGGLLGSKELGDSDAMRSLLVDGLHLTGEGYKVFLKEVLPFIGPSWASEPSDAPSWIFPHWSVAPKIE